MLKVSDVAPLVTCAAVSAQSCETRTAEAAKFDVASAPKICPTLGYSDPKFKYSESLRSSRTVPATLFETIARPIIKASTRRMLSPNCSFKAQTRLGANPQSTVPRSVDQSINLGTHSCPP